MALHTSFGCTAPEQAGSALAAQEEAALADTVEPLSHVFIATWSELELASYLKLFTEDLQFYIQGWCDREAFSQTVRDLMEAYREYPAAVTDAKIEVLGSDAAVSSVTYRAEPGARLRSCGRTEGESRDPAVLDRDRVGRLHSVYGAHRLAELTGGVGVTAFYA